jgi:hypothetical protein
VVHSTRHSTPSVLSGRVRGPRAGRTQRSPQGVPSGGTSRARQQAAIQESFAGRGRPRSWVEAWISSQRWRRAGRKGARRTRRGSCISRGTGRDHTD